VILTLGQRESISHAPNARLLVHIRIAFLEMCRSTYWRHIDEGKLPRNSTAAVNLLYSIDVAEDTVNTPGLQDWDTIDFFLSRDRYAWIINLCTWIDFLWTSFIFVLTCRFVSHNTRPYNSKGFLETYFLEYFEWQRSENAVYMLASFIEAHEYAQKKIPYYLGEEEEADTPEEVNLRFSSN